MSPVDKLMRTLEEEKKNLTPADLLLFSTMSRQAAVRSYKAPESIDVSVNLGTRTEPTYILNLGDLHVGSMSTDHAAVLSLVQYILSMDGVRVVYTGDMLEGMNPAFFGTNAANSLPITEQDIIFREKVVVPLRDRVLAAIEGHAGHEGWSYLLHAMHLWSYIYAGTDIQRVQNGGEMTIHYIADEREVGRDRHIVFHNTKSSGGGGNPLRPLLQQSTRYSGSNAPTAMHGAHIHAAAVGVENRAIQNKREKPVSIVLIQNGTAKGGEGFSDPFGVSRGMGKTSPLGQGVEVKRRSPGQGEFVYPTLSTRAGGTVHLAMQAYEQVASKGVLREVIDEMQEKAGAPIVRFDRDNSHLTLDPFNEQIQMKDYAPQYSTVAIEVNSKLPVGWLFASNFRRGSRAADLDEQRAVVSEVSSNPHLRLFLLRQLVDRDVPKSSDRDDVLDRLLKTLSPVKEKIDIMLLDGILRSTAWKKKTGNSEPVAAATLLSVGLHTPLLDSFGTVSLKVGVGPDRPTYTGQFVDALANRGSLALATPGPYAVYKDLSGTKPGFLVGGHMPGSGFETIDDPDNPETSEPHLIAPGWFARLANSSSKQNNMPAAPGWLGVIAMPGNSPEAYQLFPVGNKSHWDLLDGLIALTAIRKGWLNPEKLKKRAAR